MSWWPYPQEPPAWPVEQVALDTEQVVRACIRSLARARARAEQAGLGTRGQEVVERVLREGAETGEAATRGSDCTRAGGNDSARGNGNPGAGRAAPLSSIERRLFARWTCYETYSTTPTGRDETFESPSTTNASDPGYPAASQRNLIRTNYSLGSESWETNGLPTPPSTPPQPVPPSPPLTPPAEGVEDIDAIKGTVTSVTSFHPILFGRTNTEQHDGTKLFLPPHGRTAGATRAQTLIVTVETEDEDDIGPCRDDVCGLRSLRSGRNRRAYRGHAG